MGYGSKIAAIIGEDAWNRYRETARNAFARATGREIADAGRIHNDDPAFDWADAEKDGPQSENIPRCYWQPNDEDATKRQVTVITNWRGFEHAEKFDRIDQPSPATINPEPDLSQPARVVDTGFQPAPTGGALDAALSDPKNYGIEASPKAVEPVQPTDLNEPGPAQSRQRVTSVEGVADTGDNVGKVQTSGEPIEDKTSEGDTGERAPINLLTGEAAKPSA